MNLRIYLFNRLRELDWSTLLLIILLTSSGLLAIYSIEVQQDSSSDYFLRQSVWSVLGLLLFFGAYFIPRKLVHNLAYYVYGIGVILLLIPIAVKGDGSVSRWISVGSFSIQPSEFMKIFLLVALAKYFADHKRRLSTIKELMAPFAMTIGPTILVLLQPDLGTALVYLGVFLVVIFWAGIRPLYFFLLLTPIISMIAAFQTASFFVWMVIIIAILYLSNLPFWTKVFNFSINVALGGITNILWALLKPYQQQRILSLIDSDSDPLGAGYQVSQSLTAFGSGGPFGKGLGEGTQTHLKFLPEQHTDFIMTVIGEEFGFLGVMIVLTLFYFLIARLVNQAYNSKYRFDSVVLVAIAAVMIFHVFVNLAMIVGIMPVTGIPLPFISYGGSFMLTAMILVGLSANMASVRRASH